MGYRGAYIFAVVGWAAITALAAWVNEPAFWVFYVIMTFLVCFVLLGERITRDRAP